ncbi:hypothetical protein BDW68DRAFT_27525 [Aspergillus falconensis]
MYWRSGVLIFSSYSLYVQFIAFRGLPKRVLNMLNMTLVIRFNIIIRYDPPNEVLDVDYESIIERHPLLSRLRTCSRCNLILPSSSPLSLHAEFITLSSCFVCSLPNIAHCIIAVSKK